MRIIKPRKLGVLCKAYQFKRQNYFAVAPLVFFRLGSGEILDEAAQWPVIQKSLGSELLDMAMPKSRAEFLLCGQAHSLKPVPDMQLRVRLGATSRTLRVIGNRSCEKASSRAYTVTDPETFTAMPLGFDRAFGGEDYPANPTGTGFAPQQEQAPLPNLELPEQQVSSLQEHYPPVAFGPQQISWPQRLERGGTYDNNWYEKQYPGLPDDIDWHMFNAAQPQQWLQEFPIGGEAFELQGFSTTGATIFGTLPQLRTRVLLKLGEKFEELPTRIDTVWFLPEQDLGIVIYRGYGAIHDSDALDVDAVLLAYESSGDMPASQQEYEKIFYLRTEPSSALAHMFNESQLSPGKTSQQLIDEKNRQEEAEQALLQEQQYLIDEAVEDYYQSSGIPKPDDLETPRAEPGPLPVISREAIASGDFDLGETLAAAERLTEQAKQEARDKMAALEQDLSKILRDHPAVFAIKPADDTAEQLQELKTKLAIPVPEGGWQSALDRINAVLAAAQSDGSLEEIAPELIVVQQQALQVISRQSAVEASVATKPYQPQASTYLREQLVSWLAEGVSLAGRDLAGADLSGLNFSGLALPEVQLENAKLIDCDFSGADLSGAVLTGATVLRTSFDRACLQGANLCQLKADSSRFVGADLSKCMLLQASLQNCDLQRARLAQVTANEARLEACTLLACELFQTMLLNSEFAGCCLEGSQWEQVMLIGSKVTGCSFKGAAMTRCILANVNGDNSDFSYALLDRVQLGGESSFRDGNFNFLSAKQSGWRGLDLSGSNFAGSALVQCDLGNTRLHNTSFTDACLYESMAMCADMRASDFTDCDFYKALLRKTDFRDSVLTNAAFAEANLHEAVFRENQAQVPDRREICLLK